MDHKKVFIVIAVHNRKDITLKGLRHLQSINAFSFNIVIVDDGSVDGTSKAIKELFPEVHLLNYDGDLWWSGSMNMGMKYALEQGAEFIIWMNDDAYPKKNSLVNLLTITNVTKGITGAFGVSEIDGKVLHPGRMKTKTKLVELNLQPDMGIYSVDTVAGNLCCIHRKVINKIGYLDKKLPMGPVDFDYFLRAKKNNFPVLMDTDSIVVCDENYDGANRSIIYTDEPLITFWRKVFHLNSSIHWRTNFIFKYRYWGIIGVIWYFMEYFKLFSYFIIRLTIPQFIRKAIYKRFSTRYDWVVQQEKLNV